MNAVFSSSCEKWLRCFKGLYVNCQIFQHLTHIIGVRTSSFHVLLSPTELSPRHHLHSHGDLLSGLNCFSAIAQCFKWRHQGKIFTKFLKKAWRFSSVFSDRAFSFRIDSTSFGCS